MSNFFQMEIKLTAKPRGFHLVTDEILEKCKEIEDFQVGIVHILLKHTSAGLTINENADPTVLEDFESHFNKMVPENQPYYRHRAEGPDDMPAHIKAALLGTSLQIPIANGALHLGTWQGIYLCEHRNRAGSRKLVVTISGQKIKS